MAAAVENPSIARCAQDLLPTDHVVRCITSWLAEDGLPQGDVTSAAIVDSDASIRAALVAREAMVVAGLEPLARGIEGADLDASLSVQVDEGTRVEAGHVLGALTGSASAVLGLERTLLNALGRMAGVATLTARFVAAVAGTAACICDTRKTTPGLRRFEKYAVVCGGGTMHRMGLADAAMFKDNHLAGLDATEFGNVLGPASVRARDAGARFVVVEVDTLEQLDAVLAIDGIDIVLLDNMPPDVLVQAVTRRDAAASAVQLEASGGITLDSVGDVARTGVDRISVGALTRDAVVVDIGLDS